MPLHFISTVNPVAHWQHLRDGLGGVSDEGRVGGVEAVGGRDGHPLLAVRDVRQLGVRVTGDR